MCQKKLVDNWGNNLPKLANYTKAWQGFKVGWVILDMLYSVDTITESCTRAGIESGFGFDAYYQQLSPKTVINNFIYRFGDIFDSLRDVILFLTDDNRGVYNLPYEAGYGLGTAVYYVIKTGSV